MASRKKKGDTGIGADGPLPQGQDSTPCHQRQAYTMILDYLREKYLRVCPMQKD